MDDVPYGSPVAHRGTAQSNHQRTPSAQHKRNNRKPPHDSQRMAHFDGSVSDSVTTMFDSPRSKKPPRHHQTNHAATATAGNYGNTPKTNIHNPRPVSVGASGNAGNDNRVPATPLKEHAYAGATFQASPAPSSLPVPKFFSKSVPNGIQKSSMESRLVGRQTPIKEGSSPPPEPSAASVPPRAAQQSPLDMFFHADRVERERSRSGAYLSPELARRTPPATEPRNIQRPAGKGLFLSELDGDDSDAGMPQSLPSQHCFTSPRYPAAPMPYPKAPGYGRGDDRDAYTKSLKDLLFNNVNSAPSSAHGKRSPQPPDNARGSTSDFEGVFGVPSSSGPSTPINEAPPFNQQENYSLHYGNRNLSPLFKAAVRNDNNRPQSNLRQYDAPSHPPSSNGSGVNLRGPEVNPNVFSPGISPQQAHPAQRPPTGYFTSSTDPPRPPVTSPGPQSSNQTPPNGTTNTDVRTMENDLRRMLNLNVLSN